LELTAENKIAWLHLWPHVRAWRLAHPQPMLRALAEVDEPARLLTSAWTLAQRGDHAASTAPESGNPDRSQEWVHA
jgi:hypothetical protein